MTTVRTETTVRPFTIVLLVALYFAQGLPYGFFATSLPVILRQSGYSLTAISALGVLFAPWALTFLWAPYVDRFGSRRRWLLSMQLGSAGVAFGLAAVDLESSMILLFAGVAMINLFAATQDVATDGVAVTALDARGRGLGNGIQVGAYRLGMIAGGGGLLWLYSLASWRVLFIAMAVVLLVTTIPVWWMRDSPDVTAIEEDRPAGSSAGLWWARLTRPGVIGLIGLVAAYKFGNSMGSALIGPFLSDSGLSLRQIALLDGAVSSGAALAGAAIGGLLAFGLGRRTALLVGGVAQSAALIVFVLAAAEVGGLSMIVTANVAEHLCGGAATVAVFALMMDSADKAFAGTDYTILACAVVAVQAVAGFAAGVVGDGFGFVTVFVVATVLSGLGCLILVRGIDRGVGPEPLRTLIVDVPRGPRGG